MGYSNTANARDGQVTNVEIALQLASDGFVIFPANGLTSKPHIKGWQKAATGDPDQIAEWWSKWPSAIPALPTGSRNGVAVLDVDVKKGKDGIADLKALGLDPDGLSIGVVITPSGGRHFYFEHDDGLRSNAGQIAPGLDTRAEGGFVIAPGARGRRGVYKADGIHLCREIIDMAGLPKWPDRLRPPRRERKTESSAEKTGRPFYVTREALFAIPNDGSVPESDSRDWWRDIGFAFHHETDGSAEGFACFDEWSAQHDKYDPDLTRQLWESSGRDAGPMLTGWHILRLATDYGWRDPRIDEMFDKVRQEQEEEEAEIDALFEELVGDPSKARNDESDGLTMLTPEECAVMPSAPYVVKELIVERNVVSFVGAPGVGKSVVVPRIAYALAQGEPVFGMRTKQGKVFYVAAENERDMMKRVRVLRDTYGAADNFRLILNGGGSMKPGNEFLKKLRAAIQKERPALIVIDTLAAAIPGLDENSSEGMGNAIMVARSLTRWGAAVIIVHHDTKAGDGLPRGHSSLHGDVDMNVALRRDKDGVIRGACSKNRNGESHKDIMAYRNRVVVLGLDEDGDSERTVICDELDLAETPERKDHLTPSAKAAYEVFHNLLDGRAAVPEAEWRKACVDGRAVSASEKAESRAKTFKRAAEELTRKGKVTFSDGEYRLPDHRRETFDDMV